MDMDQQIAAEQLRFKREISIVRQYLDFIMNMAPSKENVHIHPNYPNGWEGQIVAEKRVWTIACENGVLNAIRVGRYCGTRENGTIIQDHVDDISHLQKEYLEQCYYAGLDSGVITCELFMDLNDPNMPNHPNTSPCTFCLGNGR